MHKPIPILILLALAAFAAAALPAQLLPQVGRTVGDVVGTVGDTVDGAVDRVGSEGRALGNRVQALAQARIERLTGLVARNRDALELDDRGQPAVRGQVIGVDPAPAALAAAHALGFTVEASETLEGLGVRSVTLKPPPGMSLARALKLLRKQAPGEWSANSLHFESGQGTASPRAGSERMEPAAPTNGARIGMIDGGIGPHGALGGTIEQRGFARGAPVPSAHGTAIASLIVGEGAVRGVLPGSPLLAADVYGRDPGGGNALAIARALGWMAARDVRVVSISLVGPANPLLARVIAAARQRGLIIVAAVGNDGPAAPPGYPASYPGVIAVTGVDGRNRALIEAGRALHLDYAAPGADIGGAGLGGGIVKLRGTSYAAPLVAARIAALGGGQAHVVAALDREATDLGKRGPDPVYGRGLVCGSCRSKY